MGKSVLNREGKTLGKVDDFAVDLEAGRIGLVILSSGGVLGVGAKDVAIPPRAFVLEPGAKTLRLDFDAEKFKSAPPFDKSKWSEQVTSPRISDVYRYYGEEPYFAPGAGGVEPPRSPSGELVPKNPATRLDGKEVNRPDSTVGTDSDAAGAGKASGKPRIPSAALGWVNKASTVIGLPVVNLENKKCGEIDNLILDLEAGRIVHVIVSSGGVLGIGDTLNVVPPTVLKYTSARDAVEIRLTKEQLAAAPNFKSSDWPNFGDAAYSSKVYRAYGVDPYFTSEADNTSRNVRDRQGNRLSPLNQGTSESDVETTRLLRKQINERDTLSVNAKNVKIITVNGRVTLRGPVNSSEERAFIVELARKHSRGGEVDDELEVKGDLKNN